MYRPLHKSLSTHRGKNRGQKCKAEERKPAHLFADKANSEEILIRTSAGDDPDQVLMLSDPMGDCGLKQVMNEPEDPFLKNRVLRPSRKTTKKVVVCVLSTVDRSIDICGV